mmetsp:Transcript_30586/g.88931  ORF Transcript_30586/g.88931 Transcript_30586/m.88931 type:complete len:238 (-) Transcript_30586:60-773(-)
MVEQRPGYPEVVHAIHPTARQAQRGGPPGAVAGADEPRQLRRVEVGVGPEVLERLADLPDEGLDEVFGAGVGLGVEGLVEDACEARVDAQLEHLQDALDVALAAHLAQLRQTTLQQVAVIIFALLLPFPVLTLVHQVQLSRTLGVLLVRPRPPQRLPYAAHPRGLREVLDEPDGIADDDVDGQLHEGAEAEEEKERPTKQLLCARPSCEGADYHLPRKPAHRRHAYGRIDASRQKGN